MNTSKRERELVSISQIQRMTGLDRAVIAAKLVNVQWKPGPKSAKMYDLAEVFPLLVGPGRVGGDDAKERKLTAEAEKAELQLARLKGELVPIDEVTQAAAELIKTLYQQCVRVLPDIIAADVVGLKSVDEVAIRVRERLAKVFDDARSNMTSYLTVEAESESDEENGD